MIVVSDTSPITNLMRIGRINLLRDLFETVVIPSAVYDEIAFLADQRSAIDAIEWISVVPITDLGLFRRLSTSIDRGEAEAITLSVELSASILLIDENAGRREAERFGLEVTGLIGVLIRAKDKALIELVEPELRRLVDEAGFWVSESFIDGVLVQIGEK